jgi:hypothetical protein
MLSEPVLVIMVEGGANSQDGCGGHCRHFGVTGAVTL